MAEDQVQIRYSADLSEIKKRLTELEQANTKVQTSGDKVSKSLTDGFNKSGKAVDDFSKKTKEASGVLDGLGEGLAAVFAIEKIKEFAKASIEAFEKYQDAADDLAFTIKQVIAGTDQQVSKLERQAKKLSEVPFFTHQQIEQSQTMLAQFGLTQVQIEKLIPKILNLASTPFFKGDTKAATTSIIEGIEGRGLALKKVGIELEKNASLSDRLIEVTDKLTKFDGAAASAAATFSGELKIQEGNTERLQERIGERLTPAFVTLKGSIVAATAALAEFLFPDSPEKTVTQQIEDAAASLEQRIGEATTRTLLAQSAKFADQLNSLQASRDAFIKKSQDQTSDFIQRDFAAKAAVDVESQINFLIGKERVLNDELKKRNKLSDENIQSDKLAAFQKENLSNLSIKALTEEIRLLKERKDSSTVDVRTQIDLREKAIDKIEKAELAAAKRAETARKTASEKLKDFARTDEEAALSEIQTDGVAELEQKKLNKINERRVLFSESEKTKQDEKNLNTDILAITQLFDAKIVEEKEKQAKKLKAINDKNAKEDLKDTIDALEIGGELQKQALIKNDSETGDGTKKAKRELGLELEKIDKDTRDKILEETKKANLDETKAAVDAEKEKTGLLKEEHDKQLEDDKESAKKRLKLIQEAGDAIASSISSIFDISQNFRDQDFQNQSDKNDEVIKQIDNEAAALEKKNARNEISDRAYQTAKEKLDEKKKKQEEEFAAIQRKNRHDAAIANKEAAIFNIIISTAQAIIAALASVPPNVPLSIFAGVTGALQLAVAATAPIPKLAAGTSYLDSRTAKQGTDTILMWGNRGERVVTKEDNQKHWSPLEAMRMGNYEHFVQEKYIMPAIHEERRRRETKNRESIGAAMASTLMNVKSSADTKSLERMLRNKGIAINNLTELAELIANNQGTKHVGKIY